MIKELTWSQRHIKDWSVVIFAVFYHDIVYNILKHDNEERSADIACKRLSELNLSHQEIEKCKGAVMATKSHVSTGDSDVDYFLDADLCILGSDWLSYWTYVEQIRKEFSLYPAIVFRTGRRKVIRRFLEMARIFKTDDFHSMYERQARENLQRELEL
jgi:predicted metal-dependent HD superfamily phosphohydrolase